MLFYSINHNHLLWLKLWNLETMKADWCGWSLFSSPGVCFLYSHVHVLIWLWCRGENVCYHGASHSPRMSYGLCFELTLTSSNPATVTLLNCAWCCVDAVCELVLVFHCVHRASWASDPVFSGWSHQGVHEHVPWSFCLWTTTHFLFAITMSERCSKAKPRSIRCHVCAGAG